MTDLAVLATAVHTLDSRVFSHKRDPHQYAGTVMTPLNYHSAPRMKELTLRHSRESYLAFDAYESVSSDRVTISEHGPERPALTLETLRAAGHDHHLHR